MDQQFLIQHFKKTLLGRLSLKLFHEISGNDTIPKKDEVESFLLKKFQLSPIIGELYAAILLIRNFSWLYYDNLKTVVKVNGLLKALEKFPLKNQFFIEITQCPEPFPETLGILIICSELENVDHGSVYSVYLLGEEKFPEAVIDYIKVRACQSSPYPIICTHTVDGRSTSDLKEIGDSLTIQVALKALYFLLDKRLKEEKQRNQSEIVKATKLTAITENLSARFLRQASGKIELAIIIGEQTSAEELRSAWAKIDFLKTRLMEKQGTDLNQIQYSLLYNYHQLHEHGWSYNLIAMDINYDCLVNLCQASDEIIDVNAKTISSSSFTNAYRLLQSVRMKEKDILYWLIDGLKEIRNGNSPWSLQSGPVDRQRVRDALRQWQHEEASQKVIVQKPPETETVPLDTLTNPITKRYNKMAEELLNQTFPGSYEKYYAALIKTITKTGYIGMSHV